MIPRYEKKEISTLWTDKHRFETYLKVEVALLKALEEHKRIPSGTAQQFERCQIRPDRIEEIERETKHDVIAFCTSITEQVAPRVGQYFHFGCTSSDIIDSSLMIMIKESLGHILLSFKSLLDTLYRRCDEWRDIVCLGRSHGMDAEPMSFGVKFLGHYAELLRCYQNLESFSQNELTVQLSGAVGNYTILTPEIEARAAELLRMPVETHSTQVIPRDRLSVMASILAHVGSAIERLSVEIRHLHKSDVGEVHEGFSKGQKGSSTMPHKKNPISTENLTGISRMLKSYLQIALENNVLWHERDISHSSAERLYLPDQLGLTLYALDRLNSTVENLVIHQDVIEGKVKSKFTYLSSYYLHQLIEQTDCSREDLYRFVQEAAFEGEKNKSAEAFFNKLIDLIHKQGIEAKLERPTFEKIKDIYLKHVGTIFERVIQQKS